VFLDLLGIEVSDGALRHLLADSGVDLAHLGPLADLVAHLAEGLRRLAGAQAGRGPHGQRAQGDVDARLGHHGLALLLAVLEQRVGHLDGVRFALVAETGVGPNDVVIRRGTRSHEEGGARLDVQVGKVEYDPMRNVVEGHVVVEKLQTCVDHLDVVQLFFVHGLEDGNLGADALEVEVCGLVRVHAGELHSHQLQVRIMGYDDTHVRGRDLHVPGVLREDALIINIGLEEERLSRRVSEGVRGRKGGTHLDIVLRKLLGKGASAGRGGVHGVINGNLAILMV